MFYLLYKEQGVTSFKFIKDFAKTNNIKKIGHTGTLDPLAKGLLLVATDDDTRLIEYIKKDQKTYIASGKLGILTSSFDIDTPITKRKEFSVTKEQLADVIRTFLGKQKQVPPTFSAKHIDGKRAYELARSDIEFSLPAIEIEIYKISLLKFHDDDFIIEATVSNGTYIRSLIYDVGIKCGTYATMTNLERTEISSLRIEEKHLQIDIKRILEVKTKEIEELNIEFLNSLLQGKKVNLGISDTTILIFKNTALAVIKNDQPIKVLHNNIESFIK